MKKARKQTEAYAILTLKQIRQLLAMAEANASVFYGESGENRDLSTLILRGFSVKIDGKNQVHLERVGDEKLGY